MVVDRQTGKQGESGYLPYAVRAFHYNGTSFLLDQGTFPYHEVGNFDAVVDYMENTLFTTLDHHRFSIDIVWMDLGGEDTSAAYDFCYDYGDGHLPRVEGVRGIGHGADGRMERASDGQNIWAGTRKGLTKLCNYWKINAQEWEKTLYETLLQRFTPTRHRPWAPAFYFPQDIEEDYLRQLCAMHVIDVPLRKTDPRSPIIPMYVKKSTTLVNDGGDHHKYFAAMNHWYRLQHLKRTPGLQPEDSTAEETSDTIPKVREYLLKA
jgi:hypothetical protein